MWRNSLMQSVVHVVATASTSGGSTSSTAYPALASALPAARTRPLHGHQLRAGRTLLGRRLVVGRHAAERRPDARDAAAIGGIADRAAEVVAVGERRDADGERGGGAAAAAAGGARAIPRVVGAAAQLVVGVPAQTERGRVGAADDDGA